MAGRDTGTEERREGSVGRGPRTGRESGTGRESAAGRGGEDGAPAGNRPRTKAEREADRRRRRAVFLRELNEARELRARVQPRRVRAARMRHALRMRSFRW